MVVVWRIAELSGWLFVQVPLPDVLSVILGTFMIRILIVALLAVLAFPTPASASADEAAIEKAIQSLVPAAKIDSIAESKMPNFYQVVMQGQVVYVSADGKYLFQGSMFDIANKTDLTENARADIRRSALAEVGAEQRIIFPAKDPKYTVTVFTDIDCGICRRMHSEIAGYNERGISVEYLFYPRAGIGSESYDKAVSVWCASDRNEAMNAAMNQPKTVADVKTITCDNSIARDYELARKVASSGTPTVLTAEGVQLGGYLPPDQLLARLQAGSVN